MSGGFASYAAVLRLPVVPRILLLGLLVRLPMWAGNVVLTLHVVGPLHRSYAAAGLVVTCTTGAAAVSGPWRGRMLDRLGLRRVVGPSLVVLAVCWSVAPWVGYLPLLVLSTTAGLFMIPSFSVVRQVLIHAVPLHRRTTALTLDSVAVEIGFGAGPVFGVLLAGAVDTSAALLLCELASVLGGLVLWLADPPLGRATVDGHVVPTRMRDWMTPLVAALLVASLTGAMVLAGGDLGAVAALRSLHHPESIGWVLAVWALGSALGGLVYGALPVRPPAFWLLGVLGATTAVVAVAEARWSFALLLAVSGVCCAPTLTALVDDLSRAAPARVRGEVMGWHQGAMTIGGAAAAPALGAVMDAYDWPAAFVLAGALGVVVAAAGLLLRRGVAARR